MILSKTPYRISFFGGGTDYPSWYTKHGGAVLSATINKYCNIKVKRRGPDWSKHKVIYSIVDEGLAKELKHPVVRKLLERLPIKDWLEITHEGDLLARSGIGSSSSFTVGLLNALYAYMGRVESKDAISRAAITVERNLLHERVGSQDQVAVCFGGLNRIEFMTNGKFTPYPVCLTPEQSQNLRDHLMLFYLGERKPGATPLLDFKKHKSTLEHIQKMVFDAHGVLYQKNILSFGKLLHESWILKKQLHDGITTKKVDEAYEVATNAGALGGKLLGSGGGGFLLLFAEKHLHSLIEKKLNMTPVDFDFEEKGTHLVNV